MCPLRGQGCKIPSLVKDVQLDASRRAHGKAVREQVLLPAGLIYYAASQMARAFWTKWGNTFSGASSPGIHFFSHSKLR